MKPTLATALLAATAASGAIGAAGAAIAQADPQSAITATEEPTARTTAPTVMYQVAGATIIPPLGVSVDLVDDVAIYTPGGIHVGTVDTILGESSSAAPTHVAIQIDSNAGFGDRNVVVPLDALTLQGNRMLLSLAPEQVAALPRWGG